MAKLNNSFTVTGLIDQGAMTLTEETKNSLKTFDLRKVLSEFDGDKVRFSITGEYDDSDFLADEE